MNSSDDDKRNFDNAAENQETMNYNPKRHVNRDGTTVVSDIVDDEKRATAKDEYMELVRPSLPRRMINRILYFFEGIVPVFGDHPLEFIRKLLFVAALTTLIVSATFIVNDMILLPNKTKGLYENLATLYDIDSTSKPTEEGDFPSGMLDSFKGLYTANEDTRGYIRYKSTGSNWTNIDLPVVSSGDNDFYLMHDFQKAPNKYGALFFDEQNVIESPEDKNKVLMIHGHNMANGSMFASLNNFVSRNSEYLRTAPLIQLDNLYEKGTYEIFSTMVINARSSDGPYFDYLRNSFSDDDDFMDFVENIRLRSIYNVPYVEVGPDDQLLILSTCSERSGRSVYFDDGRTVVVAKRVDNDRKVSQEELNQITVNNNVLMPKAWYENQNKPLHPYFSEEE